MTKILKGAKMSNDIASEPGLDEVIGAHFKPRTWLIRATMLSFSLGLIHILAAPLYFNQWLGYGAFFIFVAVLQIMYSAALAVGRPSRALYWVGIAGSVLVIAMWLYTRTLGIPFGPMAGEVLPIGLLDAIAQILTLALMVHLVVLLRRFDQLQGRPLIE